MFLPRWLVVGLILLVSVAWFVTTVLDLVGGGPGNPVIHGLFTTVLGFVFMIYKAETQRSVHPKKEDPKKVDAGEDSP